MPNPLPDRLLTEAAELRAEGATWETVAVQVGRALSTVRGWPALYHAKWTALLRAAEQRIATEAAAESVLILRAQLRSKDPDISRNAAQKLIQYRVALDKTTDDPDRFEPGALPHSEAARVAAHLESLSDDQRNQLLDRVVSVLSAHRDARNAGGDPPGS